MIRRLYLLFTLFLACLALAAPALAQTPATLLELKIGLWPEYDKPAMLVIYRGQIAQTAPGPATVQIQIPASAASTLSVAYDNAGQLLNANHTETVNGAILTVAVSSPNGSFDVEYYDTSLDLSSANRHFAFSATTLYAINTLTIEVQQPAGATGLSGTPALSNSQTSADGLTYVSLTRSNVAANETIKQDVSYTKSTNALSIASVTSVSQPGAGAANGSALPMPVTAAAAPGIPDWVYGTAGAIAALLVLGGLFWYARPRWRTARARRQARRAAGREDAPADPPPVSGLSTFCHECGTRSRPGDRFCGNCGVELRRSP